MFSHFLSCHLMSSDLISFPLISSHFLSSHLISSHLIPCFLISSHVVSCHLISFHFLSSHHISSHLISFHLISFHFRHSESLWEASRALMRVKKDHGLVGLQLKGDLELVRNSTNGVMSQVPGLQQIPLRPTSWSSMPPPPR